VLLCASKADEVVEYALTRRLSPALIAEYQTRLSDKKLLQAKLHEFYLQNAPEEVSELPSADGKHPKHKGAGEERRPMKFIVGTTAVQIRGLTIGQFRGCRRR
jgi:hypothetical protein